VIVKILKEDPEPIENLVPDLPQQLAALVGRTLEKDRERRIPRAEDFGRELQWIRKALQAAGDLPPMEETRYASTQVLKALHEDRQKQSSASVGARALSGAPVSRAPVPPRTAPPARPVAAPAATAGATAVTAGSNKAALMAAVAAVLVIGGGAAVWLGGLWPGSTTGTTASPPPAASPGPGAATPAPPPAPPSPSTPDPKPSMTVKMLPGGTPGGESGAPPAAAKTTKPSAPAGGDGRAAKPAPKAPAASATEKPEPPAAKPAPPPAVMVAVSMSAVYPFQVMDGSRVLSEASTSHNFQHSNSRTLRVVAADVFLDQAVRVDGGDDRRFEYTAPGLGVIDIRAARGDCRVLIGKRDLGFLPLKPVRVVAGDYEVSLSCPDGVNPRNTTTVTQGFTARVLFK
jgi:hypothetical protein